MLIEQIQIHMRPAVKHKPQQTIPTNSRNKQQRTTSEPATNQQTSIKETDMKKSIINQETQETVTYQQLHSIKSNNIHIRQTLRYGQNCGDRLP